MKQIKRITINDIARLAGVSKSTASLVLNGRGRELRVSEITIERVQSIARQYRYQPNVHARSLKNPRTNTIGLVVPEMTNYGFASFSHELEILCREAGYQLLISCTDENPSQEVMVVHNMVAQQVDGLIVASSMLTDLEYHQLSKQLPVILFDRYMPDTQLPYVVTDSVTSTASLIADVASQHQDEFYFIGGQSRLSPTTNRLAGFKQGLQQASIEAKPEWILHGNYHPNSGYEIFASLCAELGRPPKALFTAACGLMEGVLRYMSQYHLLDSDIRLVSFDDHYLYDPLSLRIDTVRQDVSQLAACCFNQLCKMIDQQPLEQMQIVLPATIVKRYSV